MSVDANGGSDVAADFHLVEAHGTWRLTIKADERLIAALADDGQLANGATFTVHVEPNLLPSGVFAATVNVRHESATTGGSETPARSTRQAVKKQARFWTTRWPSFAVGMDFPRRTSTSILVRSGRCCPENETKKVSLTFDTLIKDC